MVYGGALGGRTAGISVHCVPRHNRNFSRAHLMRARLCLSKKGNFVCEVRKIALLCAGKER